MVSPNISADDLSSRSYWLELDAYTPEPALSEDLKCDVAIIGGGFTGLWTAYHLLKASPGMSVAILEANAVGYGASGRNGGFAMTLVHRTLTHLAAYLGDDRARAVYHAAERAVHDLNHTVAEEGIACDIQPTGLITLSNTPPQDAVIEREYETARRLGLSDFEFLDRDAARARINSDKVRMAVRENACSLVNPARLARGLKAVVQRLGARVFESTRVMDWSESAAGVTIRAEQATIRAGRALIAPNAYGTTWRVTRPYVLPIYTYICLTRPLTEAEWSSINWQGREGAEDRRMFLHYFRPTIDGRILWGGRDAVFHPDGPLPAYDADPAVFARMRETFDWFFPQLRGVPFERRWGGPIAVTANFLPVIGWMDPRRARVAHAYGYNGHGVAITNLAGHAVADLMLGRRSEWTDLPIVNARPQSMGPAWLRDPMVRWTMKTQLAADDAEKEIKEPLALRVLNKVTGADLKIN